MGNHRSKPVSAATPIVPREAGAEAVIDRRIVEALKLTRKNRVAYILNPTVAERVTLPDQPIYRLIRDSTDHDLMMTTFKRLTHFGNELANYETWARHFDQNTLYCTIEGELWVGKDEILTKLYRQMAMVPGGDYSNVWIMATFLNSMTVCVDNTWTNKSGQKFGFINYTTFFYDNFDLAAGLGRISLIIDTADMSIVKSQMMNYMLSDRDAAEAFISGYVAGQLSNFKDKLYGKLTK